VLGQSIGNRTQKLLLLVLAIYADVEGVCFPGRRALAQSAEVVEETVSRHVAALKAAGLIAVRKRFRKDGSQMSNEYCLLFREGLRWPDGTSVTYTHPPATDSHAPVSEALPPSDMPVMAGCDASLAGVSGASIHEETVEEAMEEPLEEAAAAGSDEGGQEGLADVAEVADRCLDYLLGERIRVGVGKARFRTADFEDPGRRQVFVGLATDYELAEIAAAADVAMAWLDRPVAKTPADWNRAMSSAGWADEFAARFVDLSSSPHKTYAVPNKLGLPR
jgi:hypothetical protein